MNEISQIKGGESSGLMNKIRFQYLLLVTLCFFLFFINLGGWDLWDPDEPRYAEVAREMLMSGNWTLPHLNGDVYFDKPPLFFWSIALSSKIWRRMTSFTVRFPSALFASLTILLIFGLGKNLFNQRVGFFGTLILATNVGFFWLARRANIDATLTFFTTLTIAGFYLGFKNPKHRLILYFIAFLSMGLGFLTKLQVACIIPGLTVVTFLAVSRQLYLFKDKKFLLTIPIFLFITLAWIIAAHRLGGTDYLIQLLYLKTSAMFLKEVSHARPFYYYLENFPAEFFPWFLFFPSALILTFRPPFRKRPEVIFLLGWFLTNFLFFSLAKGKRELYLLPIYPAASLMVAFLWDEYLSSGRDKFLQKLVSTPQYVLLGIFFIAAFVPPFVVHHKFASQFSNAFILTIPLSLLILGGVAFACFYRFNHPERPFFVVTGLMVLLFLFGVIFILPQVNQFKSAKPFSQKIVTIVKTPDKLSFYGLEGANFNYYTGFINVKRFYRFEDLEKFFQSSKQVFCLIQSDTFKQIQGKTNIPAYPMISDKIGHREIILITNRK